jgi:integrase
VAPRREPHRGAPLARGPYVGFRKIDAERGSWIARRFDEETRKHSYKSVGWASVNFDYDKAKVDNRVGLYTLRHSFSTQAISDGLNNLGVARIVGTSLTMIERHYGQLVASAARERMAKVTML